MSLVNRDLSGDVAIRTASQVIASNGTVAFDFGDPNDIDLRLTPFKPGTRVLLLLSGRRASGTTSGLTFTVQDAPDNAGNIGTPAAAAVYGTLPEFAAATAGHLAAIVGVKVKPGRPWLRVNAVHGISGTDSFQAHAAILGVPNGV